MIDLEVSRRYARALIELAEQSGDIQRIDKDFLKVRALLAKHPEITHLVGNSSISRVEKEDFIDKIFGDEISRPLINFIKVLIHKKRFSQMISIQEEFHRLCEKSRGIREFAVLTPYSLSTENTGRLKKMLANKFKSEIRLIAEIQENMLGGMILRFDGKEINMSYRDRLEDIRRRLMQ